MIRIGQGYDVHRLITGRKLILGGEEIEYMYGLLGHSDADVLVHAIMDGMLGALALGDIGKHFPDNDPNYKSISSLLLLKEVHKLIIDNGYEIGNIDSTIVAQKPKIMPYIESMRKNISDILNINIDKISIKATTEEELGYTGRLEGIKAYSICLLNKKMDIN